MKYHPDRNRGDAEAETRFKAISAAYDCLKDAQKRAAYDQHGFAGVDPNMRGGPGAEGFGGFAEAFGDIFGDGFGGGGGRGGRRQGGGTRGANLRVKLKMNFSEIAHGANKKIKVKIKD